MSGVRFPEHFDSPIEEQLAAAICSDAVARRIGATVARRRSPDEGQPILEIHPQFQLEGWRVDMAVVLRIDHVHGQIALVECDGHDFHERTKEQAMRDRGRDRRAQAAGALMFRFTGTEIYADARACAEELLDTMWKRAS